MQTVNDIDVSPWIFLGIFSLAMVDYNDVPTIPPLKMIVHTVRML